MSGERSRIADLVRRGSRFLVASHVNPDGDAVGAQCALLQGLAELGKAADAVSADPVPRAYRFLAGTERFRRRRPRPWSEYDALFVLDCGDPLRANGLLRSRPPVPVLNIDHHATNPGFGDLNWVDPGASSSCEIVFDLFRRLGLRPAGAAAEALYTGILTDTGSFRHGSATPRAFRVASRLVDSGIDPARIAQAVFESADFGTLRVLGDTLARLRRTRDGSVVWITLSRRELARLSSPSESEEWASFPRSVATARVAICFKETAPGVVRLSFRGKGDVDVAALARRWGGGGHRSAAGATARGPLARVEREVVAAARRHLADAERAATPRRPRRPRT